MKRLTFLLVVLLFAKSCFVLSLSTYRDIDYVEDQPNNCTNKLGNCQDYDVKACKDFTYGEWMRENCCELCYTAQNTHNECTDALHNCASYGKDICSIKEYRPWVEKYCAKHCDKCTCEDNIDNCHSYGQSVCIVSEYKEWVKENCAKFCDVCAGSNAYACYYKGVWYSPNKIWMDGCTECRCVDDGTGMARAYYKCDNVCVTWQLSSGCKLAAKEPGKCCATPTCPTGAILPAPYKLSSEL